MVASNHQIELKILDPELEIMKITLQEKEKRWEILMKELEDEVKEWENEVKKWNNKVCNLSSEEDKSKLSARKIENLQCQVEDL